MTANERGQERKWRSRYTKVRNGERKFLKREEQAEWMRSKKILRINKKKNNGNVEQVVETEKGENRESDSEEEKEEEQRSKKDEGRRRGE